MTLGTPAVAGAAETATGAAGWVQEALRGLVGEGKISQEQADAVQTALQEAKPDRGPRLHARGGHMHPAAVAEALGMTPAELRTALEGGQTIRQVAAARNVDVQRVVDALVAAEKTHLDAAVAAGKVTRERADAALANAAERATALVDGQRPAGPGFGGRGGPRR